MVTSPLIGVAMHPGARKYVDPAVHRSAAGARP